MPTSVFAFSPGGETPLPSRWVRRDKASRPATRLCPWALKRDRTDRTRDDAFGVVRPRGTGTQAIYKQAQHCKTRAQFLYVNLKKKFPLDDVGDYK